MGELEALGAVRRVFCLGEEVLEDKGAQVSLQNILVEVSGENRVQDIEAERLSDHGRHLDKFSDGFAETAGFRRR